MLGTRRYAALLAVGAALAVPIVGCGDDDDDGDTTEAATEVTTEATTTEGAGGAGETVDVSLVDFAIDPANPTVKAGNVIFAVTNDGQATHALEVEGRGQQFETEDLDPGGSEDLSAELERGTYEWYCPIGNHREMGMEGELTVK